MTVDLLFLLSRVKRAAVHRLRLRTALRCALQRNRTAVKFTGIANMPGRVAFYASLEHFRHDIPAVLPRRKHDCLVAQNFMHEEFIAESRPKVFFSREPAACLSAATRHHLARPGAARHVLSFADPRIDRRMFYVALPGDTARLVRQLERSVDRRRRGLCCIVNRYKENAALPLLEQRVRFVREMGKDIDIYGQVNRDAGAGWANFANYRGPVRNKQRVLAHYDFNLCFENSDADGYITEKIIQALMAGCIPLYWGGGCYLEQTIPPACFINCRDQDPVEIHQRIRSMPQEELVAYRRAGLAFLASEQADRFRWGHWAERVAERLQEFWLQR